MPAEPDPFVAHCLELLGGVGRARSRRMFGGHGLYLDDLFVAIVADGQLYLKVDSQTRLDFEAAGCRPFVYGKNERTVALGFWSAPDEASDCAALMEPWARRALAAALRARAGRPNPASRGAGPARAGTSGVTARRRAR